MSAPGLTARQAQRRFVLLTGLRWLPVGFVVPVTVLLASARGLTPVQIGLAFTAHGVVVVALELPTGGLADALGRRPVLLASSVLSLLGMLGFVVAHEPWAFALAYGIVGVGRALDSGPLESWYVDAVHQLDGPAADPTVGLARAGVANGVALALGAVAGGLLPLLPGAALTLPYLAAAGVLAVQGLCVALLVVPVGRAPVLGWRGPLAALRTGAADVPRVVGEAVALARRDRALRLILLLSAGTGAVLVTLELLVPLRFAELAGSAAGGARGYGVVVALGFAGAAVGSGLSPLARRAAGGSAPRAVAGATVLAAVAVASLGRGDVPVVLAVGFAAFYLCNGAAWPLRQRLLHQRVTAAHRSSMVSVMSLALQAGGLLANQVAPRLYAVEHELAFGAAGVLLLVLGGVSLRLPGDGRRPVDNSGHGAPAALRSAHGNP